MNEPRWLSGHVINAMHLELIREHGGSTGVRDDGMIETALARPQNKWTYGDADIPKLAAAYCHGLAKNHGFVDGNKRIAFMAAYVFLRINGLELIAPEPEAYVAVTELAAGESTEEEFARWLAARVEPRGSSRSDRPPPHPSGFSKRAR